MLRVTWLSFLGSSPRSAAAFFLHGMPPTVRSADVTLAQNAMNFQKNYLKLVFGQNYELFTAVSMRS